MSGQWAEERGKSARFLSKRVAAIREQLDEVSDHISTMAAGERAFDPVELAHRLYEARRARERAFPPGLFGEPAWDLLLDLFVARHDGREVTVSSACLASAVPPTTGLRWLEKLEAEGMLTRRPQGRDGRCHVVELTAEAEARMVDLLLRLSGMFVP